MPTGRCLIVVTPDAQRTMNTYLGVSSLLGPDDVDEALVAAGRGRVPGGLPLRPADGAKEAYRKAAAVAHAAGGKVSLTLSDSFCVDRHRDDFLDLVERQVDVLFAQRGRADGAVRGRRRSTTRSQAVRGALRGRGRHPRRGGLGGRDRATSVHVIDAQPVAEVVDTTGAGDLYAAGFLYGLTHGTPLADCGRLGSMAAAEVIAHVGPARCVSRSSLA